MLRKLKEIFSRTVEAKQFNPVTDS